MAKMKISGKEYSFKNIKVRELNELQRKVQESIESAKNEDDIILAIGEMVSHVLDGFEPKNIFEVQPHELTILQSIHMLIPYYATNRSKKEIEEITNKIIDVSIEKGLQFLGAL